MNKFGFSYEKFIELLKENEKSFGDISGDNGQARDALILCYFLIQKYDYTNLDGVINEIVSLSSNGIDKIASKVVENILNIYPQSD